MKVLVVLTLAFVALATAKRDRSKILINDRKVAPVDVHSVPNKPSTRIVNGHEVEPHSRPWQVQLYISTWDDLSYCGGSLIDEQNILTAAHCFDNAIGVVEVILGAHNIKKDEATQVFEYSIEYLCHEDYNPYNLRNDIAVARLLQPVVFNANIRPIPLDTSSCSYDYTGRQANVSGWGYVSDHSFSISPVLREVTLTMANNEVCLSYYGSYYVEPTNILCTRSSKTKNICDGDTGGALVIDRVQIGIVSFGSSAGCEASSPAVFTRVCQYGNWIEQAKNQLRGSSSRLSVCSSIISLLLLFIFITY